MAGSGERTQATAAALLCGLVFLFKHRVLLLISVCCCCRRSCVWRLVAVVCSSAHWLASLLAAGSHHTLTPMARSSLSCQVRIHVYRHCGVAHNMVLCCALFVMSQGGGVECARNTKRQVLHSVLAFMLLSRAEALVPACLPSGGMSC